MKEITEERFFPQREFNQSTLMHTSNRSIKFCGNDSLGWLAACLLARQSKQISQ